MEPPIFIIYGLIQLVLMAFALQIWWKRKRLVYLILPAIAAALAYDNFIIAAGAAIGAGSTLQSLNSVRFMTHALLTPLMSLYALRLSRNAGLKWSWKKVPATAVAIIVAALVILGVAIDIIGLQLELVADWNTLRYVNGGWQGPPIPAIITIIILLFMGISMAVRTRWVWLLLGALTMFIISGAVPSLGILANLAEILLVVAMLTTARHFPHQTREEYNENISELSGSLGKTSIQV